MQMSPTIRAIFTMLMLVSATAACAGTPRHGESDAAQSPLQTSAPPAGTAGTTAPPAGTVATNASPAGTAATSAPPAEPGSGAMALPKSAICRVCEAKGATHGQEPVAASRFHDGRAYFFCSDACAAEFDANPAFFVVAARPKPLPAAIVHDLSGNDASLADVCGRVTLIDFWATWCKPCIKAMPKLQKLHDELVGEGFRVVGISIDEKNDAKVREFVAKKKFTYPLYIDNETRPAWESFYVVAIPALFLVDSEGMIVKQWAGEAKWEDVELAVREAVAAMPRK